MNRIRFIYIIVCLLCTITLVQGVENKILFNRLDVNNGLSSNEVTCIYKDRKGFMWFGSSSGLSRFDGYEFRTFRHEVDGALFSEAYVTQITETADRNLWISYEDGKVGVYNPVKNIFLTLDEARKELDLPANISGVFQGKDLQLIFCTSDNRLYAYDYSTRKAVVYPVDPSEGQVCDVYQKGEILYVIHTSGVIEMIDLQQGKSILKNGHLKKVCKARRFMLFIDSDNEIWVYPDPESYGGLYRFTPRNGRWKQYNTSSSLPLNSSLIRGVEEDSEGVIWIAADHGGLNLLDKKTETIRYLKNNPFDLRSISQNSVISLYKDDTGIIWTGTYKNGINYYHESIFKFRSLRYPVMEAEDAEINDCNCVLEDRSGNLWIGTNGNGLLYYNRTTGQYRKYRHDPADPSSISSNIVVCLENDASGNLWIGTYVGGLDCFDGNRFKHYRPQTDSLKELSNNSVYSLYADEAGNLWIGTLGGGMDCLDLKTGEWSHFHSGDPENPLGSDYIYSISKGNKDELLIGTSLGVNMLDTKSGRVSSFKGEMNRGKVFNDKAINTVYRDSRNLLWIGSNNGLTVYDPSHDKLYQLDKTNGLPDNDIMSIREDDTYVLWLGTKNGLLQLTPHYKKDGTYQFNCITYYENEGVQGRVFNRNSVCRSASGELIFGGTNGLTVFNPSRIKYNFYPPTVAVTGFLVQNDQILPGQPYNGRIILQDDISYCNELSLQYDERSFSLNIAALSYFLPEKNRFSYIMEGFDKKWATIDAVNRNITYTNLSPGTYTFLLKAENNDGVWGQEPIKLKITIMPPFWGTNWAIFLYCILAAIIVFAIIRGILHIQKRKFEKEQERIRANQLHEMDEMKLRFFTNVSHEFRTPLSLIITPIEKLMKSESNPENQMILKLIYQNANQLLRLVNQLLDFRKIDVQGVQLLLSSGDIVLFVRNITYSFKELSEKKNIRFSYTTSFPSLVMKFDTDKVFKIVSNLLSNAFKFTPEGGEISVNLSMQQDEEGKSMLLIQVIDTGIGIEEDKYDLIFNRFYQIPSEDKSGTVVGTGIGLHLCREFVKLHNGAISVRSQVGKGSTFTVSLPIELPEIQEIISSPDKSDTGGVGERTGISEENEIFGQTQQENTEMRTEPNKPTLLIVDDNADFREFMKLSLSGLYHVFTADDGEQAWKVILAELPDMVVSDVMMPVTDGIVLCKRIKQDIRTSHIPVILLTAKSAEESKMTGLEAGADDYIGKPFNMDMLILKIQHLVEMKKRLQKQFMQSSQTGIQLADIPISSMDEQLMRKAIAYIEEQIANPELSVERLSREMGMSRVNFYKKTLSITGKTPVELIRAIRMKRAAQLLEKSQMRINEVASEVGFNDIKLFRKYFKDEFGTLPSDYMKKE